jgi:hypothetical protein
MSKFKSISFLVTLSLLVSPLFARDIIAEGRAAYYWPFSSTFRDCYEGSGLYGAEITMQLRNSSDWYLFGSVDYYQQKGHSLSSCDSTKLQLVPLAIGLKYFTSLYEEADFYVGLGFQPIYTHKKSRRAYVTAKKTSWAFGCIVKTGAYVDLPHNLVLDFFSDYSLAWTSKKNFYGNTVKHSRANLSGAIFGVGLGYRF